MNSEQRLPKDAPERKLATAAEVEAAMEREVARAVRLGAWLARGGR